MKDYRDEFYSNYHITNAITSSPHIQHYRLSSKQYKGRWQQWLPQDKQSICLDLACGAGEFLFYLKSQGYENIYGIDLNPVEINHAQQVGITNAAVGDVRDYLKHSENQFDLISAFNLFEHLRKDEILDLLKLIHQKLKSGGRLIAITPNGVSPFGGTTRYWDFSHETGFTPASWRQLARLYGFASAQFEEYGPLPHPFRGRVRMILWQGIRLVLMAVSYIEVASPRDASKVYNADMKIILTKA